MRLYSFKYVDNKNLLEFDLKNRIYNLLQVKSNSEGWADFSFYISEPAKNSKGNLEYLIEVFGVYLPELNSYE